MSEPRFSDEDLTAYLDGEADATLRAEIDTALASDPTLSKRLEDLDIPMDALRAEADALARAVQPIEVPVSSAVSVKGWMIAASLAAGLVVGAGAMRLVAPTDTWVDAVASYQALYVPATLAGAPQPPAVTEDVIAAFEAEAGLSLDGVTEVAGLTFKRAQTLGIGGRRLLQLAYVTEDGTPVAYCLTLVSDADRPAQHGFAHGLGAVDWVRDGTGFVLVGDLPADQLRALQASLPGA